jgi:hypothetical protein
MSVTENSLLVTNTSAKFNAFGVDPSNGDVLGATPRSGTNSTIERLVNTNPPPVLRFTGVALSGTDLLLSGGIGPANQSYYLLSATNFDFPFASWSAIATGLFDSVGNFSTTTSLDTNSVQRLYKVQSHP